MERPLHSELINTKTRDKIRLVFLLFNCLCMRALRALRRSVLSNRPDSLRCLCAVAMAHNLVLDPFVLRSFDEPTGCLYQFDKAAFESSTSTHHRHRLPSTDAPRARLSSFSEPL